MSRGEAELDREKLVEGLMSGWMGGVLGDCQDGCMTPFEREWLGFPGAFQVHTYYLVVIPVNADV